MVTQSSCSYCIRLEEEILQPLRASGQFAEQVRFTAVDIEDASPLVDFDGSRTTTTEFANRYQGFGTPTLLFLSPKGDVLALPKFGVPDIIDFYAYEIEETIRGLPPVN
jgi:thioredoxin-related protein